MMKRMISFIMAIVLIVGMLPPNAFAMGASAQTLQEEQSMVMPENHSEEPEGTPDDQTGEDTEEQPGEDTEKLPGEDTEEQPGEDTEEQPGEDTEEQPGEDTEEQPGEDTEEQPGEDTEEQPGEDTEEQPGEDTEEQPDEDIGELACNCEKWCIAADDDCPACAQDVGNCAKAINAEELAELYRALPDISEIEAMSEEELSGVLKQIADAAHAFDAMIENDWEQAALFEENYAQLYMDAVALEQEILGYTSSMYARMSYDPNSSRNATITLQDEDGNRITGATIVVTRGNDTFEVEELGNGRYAFTRNTTMFYYSFSITVNAEGYKTKTENLSANNSQITITLEADGSEPDWQAFRVFYIANGKLPSSYAGWGSAADYGPSANDTPLLEMLVDINKLKSDEYADVVRYEVGENGNQYHFIPNGANGDMDAVKAFWAVVKECLHEDSIAEFQSTGLYDRFCVYVLKKQGDGSQHADGVLVVNATVTNPSFVIELYNNGTHFHGGVTDKPDGGMSLVDVKTVYDNHLGLDIEWDSAWNGNTLTGVYTTATNAYTVTLRQTKMGDKENNGISYEKQTDTYYLAAFDATITEGAEGYHTVCYTDGVANATVFADQVTVVQTGTAPVPAFSGEPSREGYYFSGWLLEGTNTVYTNYDISQMEGVRQNMVFHATWTRIPTEFTATIEVLLNDTYPTDMETLLDASNVTLAIRDGNKDYITLSHIGQGVFTAEVPNGVYNTYYSTDDGATHTPIDDRTFVINSATGGRKIKFYSVAYDLNGGTAEGISQLNFHHAGTQVNVTSVQPTKEGFVFAGWKSGEGTVYQSGDVLSDYIVNPYTLTAQWEDAIDVTVTVVIEHHADVTDKNDEVTFNLVQMVGQTTVHTGKSRALSETSCDGYTVAKADTTITYTPNGVTFANLVNGNYTVTTYKSGYVPSVTKVVDDNGDQHITLKLTYEPEYFQLQFAVQMDDDAMEHPENWPQAVRVRVFRWEEDGWTAATQHMTTSARIELNRTEGAADYGKGYGYVNVAKYWPGVVTADGGMQSAYYRIEVTAFIMPDGTTVQATRTPGSIYTSGNGIYTAVVTVEGDSKIPDYPDVPELKDALLEAAYCDAKGAQNGVPTATVSIRDYDVTFVANTVAGGKVEGKDSHTIAEQIKIPAFADFALTSPGEGYLFEGWYESNGTATGEWGKQITAGMTLNEDITVYAKWKAPITVEGQVFVAASYMEDGEWIEIHDIERIDSVVVILRQEGVGGNIRTVQVPITYTEGQNYGLGEYAFENLPDSGKQYYIEKRVVNYSVRYQNEPDSLDKAMQFDTYSAEANTALLGETDPSVATVNTRLDFAPDSFDLNYKVDATAISEAFRPDKAEVLVTYKGETFEIEPSLWNLISQMDDGEGDVFNLVDGIGTSSYPVWKSFPNGSTMYEYGIRLEDLQNLGSHIGDAVPYHVEYEDPAYFVGTGQNKLLVATVIPNSYPIVYELGVDHTAITNMENAPQEHTWSFETDLSGVSPKRTGYEFQGWYADPEFTTPVTKISAETAQKTTVYARWLQVQDSVNLTVTILHTPENSDEPQRNIGGVLNVQLTQAKKDDTLYEDAPGMVHAYLDSQWHNEETGAEKDVFTVAPIFSRLSSAYAYSLNVSLYDYIVVEKTVNAVQTEQDGPTTYNVNITLRYNPKLLHLTLNAKMAEGIDKNLWPVSAEIKITSFYADQPDGVKQWNVITQHEKTSLTITLDEEGKGDVVYPVWRYEGESEIPYYYRMNVIALHLQDGTIVKLDNENNEQYTGGNYWVDIETEGCGKEDGMNLVGAFFDDDSSSQQGTVTAVISTNIWNDDKPDHLQVQFVFHSADESQGTVGEGGTVEQVINLEKNDDGSWKNVTPNSVTLHPKAGYTFKNWTDENGIIVANPFVEQEVDGGKTYHFYAHWQASTVGYTVNYLDKDNSEKTLQDPVEAEGAFNDVVDVSKHNGVEFEGYVYDHAQPDPLVLKLSGNVLNLYYAKDENKDGIADYQQAIVKFVTEDENKGTVSGELTQVFTLPKVGNSYQGNVKPQYVSTIAKEGYKFDAWVEGEDEDTVAVQDPFAFRLVEGGNTYTITATWTPRTDYTYIVKYLDKVTGTELKTTETRTGQTYLSTVEETAPQITGYALDGANKQSMLLDADGKEMIFYYNLREDLSLTVKHREYGDNETVLHPDTVVSDLPYNSKPVLKRLIATIDGFVFYGYGCGGQFITDAEAQPVTIGVEENVVTIYYQRQNYNYSYEYYFDGVKNDAYTDTNNTASYGTVITSYKPLNNISGYALDKVEGLPLTVSHVESQNVVKVYYSTSTDGVIPDKYRAKVTYRIRNGHWLNEETTDGEIVDYYNLYAFNSEKTVWEPVEAVLYKEQIPSGEGNTGYQMLGQWDHEHLNHNDFESMPVTQDMAFTLSFDRIRYNINVQVTGGTTTMDGKSYTSPFAVDHSTEDVSEIAFAANNNYALDSITLDGVAQPLPTDENGKPLDSFTVEVDHKNHHNLTVIFKPDNNDNIPDNRQAKVTFKIVDGTWTGDYSGNGDIIHYYDLWRIVEGVWDEVENPTIQEVPDSQPNTGYFNGVWDPDVKVGETEVKGDAVYTRSFTLENFTIAAEVVNGTAKSDGNDFTSVEVSYHESNTTKVYFEADEGYALDFVRVNNEYIELSKDENGQTYYTFDHKKDYTIYVVYEKDEKGKNGPDGIPDKYQATVTYHVVNGTWADGSKEPISYLITTSYKTAGFQWELIEPAPTLDDTIPKTKPNENYVTENSGWDVAITKDTPVTKDVVYTYTYHKLEERVLSATVVNGSAAFVNAEGKTVTYTDPVTVSHSDSASTNFQFNPLDGYALESITLDGNPIPLTKNSAGEIIQNVSQRLDHSKDHHITVVYAPDQNEDKIPDEHQAKITFKIIDGTWTDTKNKADKTDFYTLEEYVNGQWVAKENVLITSVPEGKADEGFINGIWAPNVQKDVTKVLGDAVYILSYTLENFTIVATVENGTATSDGQPFTSVEVPFHKEEQTTVVFKPKDGYALDYVRVDGVYHPLTENGEVTVIVDHMDDHNIYVAYAKDILGGTEEDPGDGIPDKYQATVTYHVVNGKWKKDGDTELISALFTLYEKIDNQWKQLDPAPTLGDTVPVGMVADTGYHGGQWNTTITAETPVTRSASYTFTFDVNYYNITAEVINGTAKAGQEIFTAVSVPHSTSAKTALTFHALDDGKNHYTMDSMIIDEVVQQTLKNNHTFKHDAHHHIRVEYALDNIDATNDDEKPGDDIPDKYQKKVIFRVVNGTWSKDAEGKDITEVVRYVNLMKDGKYDVNGTAEIQMPADLVSTPATGYDASSGSWDVAGWNKDNPDVLIVSGMEDVVYTYTYSSRLPVTVIIEVINGESRPVHSSTVYDYDETNHTITFHPADGYVLDSAKIRTAPAQGQPEWRAWTDLAWTYDSENKTGTYTHNHSAHQHIRVEFTRDRNNDGQPDYKQAGVQFVSGLNGTVGSENAIQVFTLTDEQPQNVTVKPVETTPNEGYKFSHWVLDGERVDETFQEDTMVTVTPNKTYVYTAVWEPIEVNYTIHYRDEAGYVIQRSTTHTGTYGTQVEAKTWVHKINGYVYISGNPEVLTLGAYENQNVITLTYGQDVWKDTPDGTDSETGGDGIPDSRQALIRFTTADETKGTLGGSNTIQVFTMQGGETSKVITPAKPDILPVLGHRFDHWEQDGKSYGDNQVFVPMVLPTGTVRTYVAHWALRSDLSLTVNHLDLSGTLLEKEVKENCTFGETVEAEPYAFIEKDEIRYVFDHAEQDSIVIALGTNVLNLYYARDVWVDPARDPDPTKPGDGIADYKQVLVQFRAAEGGSVQKDTVQVFTLAEDENSRYTGTVEPVRAAKADAPGVLVVAEEYFAEDYWSRDEAHTVAVNPFQQMQVEGGQTVTFTVHFAADANKNGVPDKYQATVTYKVQSGFWNDDTAKPDSADKVHTFNLATKDENTTGWVKVNPAPTLGDSIPDVSKATADAALGLQNPGHWGSADSMDDDPTAMTAVVDGAVYIFCFTERIPYEVTVIVENGSFTVDSSSTVQMRRTLTTSIVAKYDDDLKLNFAPNVEEGKNFVLESVSVDDSPAQLTEGSYSFEDIRANHVIRVVYGDDQWVDPDKDPDPTKPGDGISDAYQIKVSYQAVPADFGTVSKASEVKTLVDAEGNPIKRGNVSLDGSIASVKPVDSGRNVFVNWTDTESTPAPGTSAGNVGEDALLKLELEDVSGGSEYHFYANFRHEMAIQAVYMVEYHLWDDTKRCYVQDEDAAYMGRGFVGDKAEAPEKDYPDYALNTNLSVLSGEITQPVEDPATGKPVNLLILKVYYDKDLAGDEGESDDIPDIYQKKVTFKVVNGKWEDLSTSLVTVTERVVYLTLRDANGKPSSDGTAILVTPTDMQANSGYGDGKWDSEPPTEVSGTEAVTYTYRYEKLSTGHGGKKPWIDIPKTGDEFHIEIWVTIMALSLTGAAGFLVAFKGNKKKKD